MGLFGLGRAFDYQFRPRMSFGGPPMRGPRGPIFGGGRHVSIHESVHIQNGPSGFWGFMTGLTQGFFASFGAGAFFGLGGGSLPGGYGLSSTGGYAPLGGALANPTSLLTPQGTNQSAEDKHLSNLTEFYGNKYIIKSHPDKPGKYQAVSKDGGAPIEGTYQELCNKLGVKADKDPDAELKEQSDVGSAKNAVQAAQQQGAEAKVKPQELKQGVEIEVMDKAWDDENPGRDGHINGKTTVDEKAGKNTEGFYKLITIGGKRYELQSEKVNGDPVYKSLDGQGKDTYRLSKVNGELVLIQETSDEGKLDGVGTPDFSSQKGDAAPSTVKKK